MNNYKVMNRLFLSMVIVYLVGVNVAYYFMYDMILTNDYMATVICEFFVMLMPAIYCMRGKLDSRDDLGFRYFKSEAVLPVVATAVLAVPVVAFISLISQLFVNNAGTEIAMEIYNGTFGMNVIFIAVVPALVEEAVFRGVFYQHYRKHGVLAGMFFTAMLFGFFHMNFNQFSYAIVASIYMTFLVEATGSVWASVLAHLIINLTNVLELELYRYEMSLLSEEELAELTTTSADSIGIGYFIGSAVVAVICIWLIVKLLRRICNICDRHFTKAQLVETEKVKRWTISIILGIAICLAYMIRYEIVS